jgi:hypothetical protein
MMGASSGLDAAASVVFDSVVFGVIACVVSAIVGSSFAFGPSVRLPPEPRDRIVADPREDAIAPPRCGLSPHLPCRVSSRRHLGRAEVELQQRHVEVQVFGR